jgi:hypothetical protein
MLHVKMNNKQSNLPHEIRASGSMQDITTDYIYIAKVLIDSVIDDDKGSAEIFFEALCDAFRPENKGAFFDKKGELKLKHAHLKEELEAINVIDELAKVINEAGTDDIKLMRLLVEIIAKIDDIDFKRTGKKNPFGDQLRKDLTEVAEVLEGKTDGTRKN